MNYDVESFRIVVHVIFSREFVPSLLKGQCPDYAHARASSVFS